MPAPEPDAEALVQDADGGAGRGEGLSDVVVEDRESVEVEATGPRFLYRRSAAAAMTKS